ncbi:nicotine adenine dinucleotide glycohydrolase (NADase) [Clostridium tepidiprofundi DSM 19306]|uniref:Nicotine adenine dinucleotide glycohydrolase (NADase) n=1 Tax=Clostridium tepidiprofundi DSM 19306 TaxID=1121338 RepID=A0A151B4Z8_9CLOT|nr:discoidin domain-containing protein [Clostridium tepidiprofundi]KYH34985.1 nicotine adenine dinucleotide glycohydrolase (NADase) [Clostridium tepidiprofundi DSM 19306]
MKKILSPICIGILLMSLLGVCTKTNAISETQYNIKNSKCEIAEGSNQDLENQISRNEFGEKEIKEFLLKADSWIDDWNNYSFKITNKPIGLIYKTYFINEIDISQIKKRKEFKKLNEKLKKYYSDNVIKGELRRLGIICIDGEPGKIMGLPTGEINRVIPNSKIKLLINEKNRKVVSVQKMDVDLNIFETKYELCKNEEGNWIITNEEDIINDDVVEKCISPKWSNITASSSLEGYSPELIVDNNIKTAWVEGKEKDGVGEWIQLTSNNEFEISSISIENGYKKSSDLYLKNNRVKKARLEFSNGETKIVTFEDTNGFIPPIRFDKIVKTKYIKLTILEVYKGTKYSDTCISEMLFFNQPKKETIKEQESPLKLEMEVYKLNMQKTLSDNEIKLMINYLGKINWEKYNKIEKEYGVAGFDTAPLLLRYNNYTSKELLYIYKAFKHSDGASAEDFGVLLYKLHKKYPKESMSLYTTNSQYKETIDMLVKYYSDMNSSNLSQVHNANSNKIIDNSSNNNISEDNDTNNKNNTASNSSEMYKMLLYTEAANENSSIKIEYPRFSGNGFDALNKLIYDKVKSFAKIDTSLFPSDTGLTINYQSAVTLQNSKIISIVFWGSIDIKGSAHPFNKLIPLNIDLQSMKEITLKDLYTTNADFKKTFFDKAFFPTNPMTSYDKANFAKMLKLQSSKYQTIDPFSMPDNVSFFLKPDGIVLSMPAIHATGSDHFEAELKYNDIQQFYMLKQNYWEN